jgi:hypothetical protein
MTWQRLFSKDLTVLKSKNNRNGIEIIVEQVTIETPRDGDTSGVWSARVGG